MKKLVEREQEEHVTQRSFDKTKIIDFGEGEWRLRYYEEKFHIR